MIRYPKYKTTATPVSGSVAWNSGRLNGDLVSIHVVPTTSTTTFKLRIQDADGVQVYCTYTSRTGEFTASYDGETINDILTFTISEASVDEVFTVILRMRHDAQNR